MVTLGFLILEGITIGNLQESKTNEIRAESVDIVSVNLVKESSVLYRAAH